MAMGAGLHLCVSGDVKLHAFLLLGAKLHVLQLALRKHPHLFPGIVCSYTWSTCAQFFLLGDRRRKGSGGNKERQEVTEKWMSTRDQKGEEAWPANRACYHANEQADLCEASRSRTPQAVAV